MPLSLLMLNWMNRRRLILFIFWYSLFMLLGMAYYSHVHISWQEDSHLLRVYNSVFLPTPSPLLRKQYLRAPPRNPMAPLFVHNTNNLKPETTKLNVDRRIPNAIDYQQTKHNFLKLLNNNFSQFLIREPSIQVQNLSNSVQKVKNVLLSINESRTTTPSVQRNTGLSRSPLSSNEDRIILSPSYKLHNSTYLLVALEKNMQKIREETEISLKRLTELNKIINAPNETFTKSISLLAGDKSAGHVKLTKFNETQYASNHTSIRPLDSSRYVVPSNLSHRARVQEQNSRQNHLHQLKNVFSGSVVGKRRPQGEEDVTHSVIRSVADRFRQSTPNHPITPVPEVDGYYLLETRTKLHLHCKSCAVVSSSGQLLNKSAGAEIDSYPCVIRMNSAPITGYQADVGTRTTARVMGHVNLLKLNQSQADQHQIFVNRSTRTQRLIIPWLFNTRVDKRKDKHYAIAKNFSKTYTNTEFYMLSSSKIAFAENLFQTNTGISRKDAKTWLSTGWMTLIFALDTCDRTDVFGLVHDKFCKENPNNTTPYHYYEVNGKKECEYYMQSETHLTSGHVFVTEKAIFARWARKFNLNFRYPTWNLTRNESAPLDTPFVKIYKEAQHNKSLHGNKVGGGARGRSHVLNLRSKKMPPIIGPKTKEDTEKEKYQRFTHAVMFIVAIFLSLVVFLLLFLLVSILTI